MKKSEFFAILNNENNKIGVTAHIAVFGGNELIIRQTGAPNSYLSAHRATTTLNAAFTKYNSWLNEWFVIQAAHAEALIMNASIEIVKPAVTCKPLQEDAKLPKVKPFHVTFSYHHSRFGDGLQMMNKGFSDLQFVNNEREDLKGWEAANAPRPTFHRFLDERQKEAELTIENGLAIYRTAIHNLNQWGSGESGHYISRNFEFLNPENVDFY